MATTEATTTPIARLSPEARAAERSLRRKGRYHAPPVDIRLTGDIEVSRDWCTDYYVGAAESLAAAGLLSRDLFPGQPGQPLAGVTYRPIDGRREVDEQGHEEGLHELPGYMQVSRLPSGAFRISLKVSRAERRARRTAREALATARKAEAERLWVGVSEHLRWLCESHLKRFGLLQAERLWSNRTWTATNSVEDVAPQVLAALELSRIATRVSIQGMTSEDVAEAASLVKRCRYDNALRPPERASYRERPAYLRLVWSAGSASQ